MSDRKETPTPSRRRPRTLRFPRLLAFLLAASATTPGTAENAFVEIEKITPSPASSSTRVGFSVDLSGDWAVTGGGKVFVMHRDPSGNWSYHKELLPSGIEDSNGFGATVAIAGDTIAVGAPQATVGLPTLFNSGAVYIYKKDHGGTDNWGFFQRITTGNGEATANAFFGSDLALDGQNLLIGVPENGVGHPGAGRAQIFREVSNAWAHEYTLAPSDGADNDGFGFSVDLYNDVAVVSSQGWPDKKAYLYQLPFGPTGAPTEIQIVPNGGADAPGLFGTGITVQGTTLAVSNHTKVEIFERHSGGTNNWGYVDTLVGPNTSFGSDLAVYGSTLLVGNLSDSSGQGKVSVYRALDTARGVTWTFVQDLTAADGVAGDFFSHDLALDAGTAIIGASEDDNSEGGSAGAAYFFEDVPVVDLSLTNTDGASTIPRGGSTTYTIQVTNNGVDDVVDALMDSDILLGSVDTSLSSWTCAPDPGATVSTDCPAGGTHGQIGSGVLVDLGAGESLTFLYEVVTDVFNPASTLQNRARITPPVPLADKTPGDNEVLDSNTFVDVYDLFTSAVPSTETPNAGDTFVVTATLESNGPSQGSAQLEIYLTPELTYVGAVLVAGGEERGDSGPPCNAVSSRGSESLAATCNTGLGPGQSAVYDITLQVDAGFTGIATSRWNANFFIGSDPNPDNNEVSLQSFVGISPIIFADGFEDGNTLAWQ